MTDRWIVDLHSHTYYSKDCIVRFEWIIDLCRKRGIDRIAITDHNTADSALAMRELAPDLVIPGEEIMTTQGEILAYYVTETVPPGLSPEETIQRLRDQGAVISVSHPFDRLRKGAWERSDLERILPLVDAIEVFNARCLFRHDNQQAAELAAAHGVPGTAGSDAHSRVEYGAGTLLMEPFDGPESFLNSLRTAEVKGRLSAPHVHLHSSTAKWMKKLGLRPSV
ncbi:histidinol-phosphatase [Anaerolineae bacterium CFX9]|nr:histidinol-phosphatase [Anaerolineae bacterium CFX9]